LYDVFDANLIKTKGWAVKAFALLASSFQNAILMDADVSFLQPPGNILKSALYGSKRALFYQDRSMCSVTLQMLSDANLWIKKMAPKLFILETDNNRFAKLLSSHQQESGVVVIDKKARFVGLLATCLLNVDRIRDEAYKHMYGDKETFWIGFEIVGEPYSFNPYIPGSISTDQSVDDQGASKICSVQMVHVDENYNPIWINGGLTENKNFGHKTTVPEYKYYLLETNRLGHQQGTWSLKDGWYFCLTSNNPVSEFPEESKSIFEFARPLLEDFLGNPKNADG
jgi:hypothetical protein